MRRGMVATVVLALVATLLGGCTSGTEEEPPAPTASRSASPSPSAAPPTSEASTTPVPTAAEFDARVPPVAPDGLSGPPSAQAAGEVAGYFMQLFPYASATGDLKAWNRLSGSACDYCDNARAMIQSQLAAGDSRTGGEIAILDLHAVAHREREFGVFFKMQQGPWQTLDADGEVVESGGTTKGSVDMVLRWDGQAWFVDGVALQRASEQ